MSLHRGFNPIPILSSLSLSSQENMLQILGLSLKYFLEELSQLVDSFLERKLSAENIFMIAAEVDRISATRSREMTIQYFLRHWRRLARSFLPSFLP
jgi:hypothetical protein